MVNGAIIRGTGSVLFTGVVVLPEMTVFQLLVLHYMKQMRTAAGFQKKPGRPTEFQQMLNGRRLPGGQTKGGTHGEII